MSEPHPSSALTDAYSPAAFQATRNLADAKARIETLQAELAEARAKVERAREALDYYAKWHPQPSDGPWGADSTDFGDTARAALKEIDPR